jgi:hypothetical protein
MAAGKTCLRRAQEQQPAEMRTWTMWLPELMEDIMEISRARLLNHSVSPEAGRCSTDNMAVSCLPNQFGSYNLWDCTRYAVVHKFSSSPAP